jgi:hypothetical protein
MAAQSVAHALLNMFHGKQLPFDAGGRSSPAAAESESVNTGLEIAAPM